MKNFAKILITLCMLAPLFCSACSPKPAVDTEILVASSAYASADTGEYAALHLSDTVEFCTHEHWKNGVCTSCGAVCLYHLWENGVCRTCGLVCPHPEMRNGVCTVCGNPCQHEMFQGGVCMVCGYVCPHETHDPDSCRCTVCGEVVHHTYHNGVCSCGKTVEFLTSDLPSRFFDSCPSGGTVESVTYQTHDYVSGVPEWTWFKKMNVYLPYNYDPSQPYNVLVLMHGMGNGENYWLQDPCKYFPQSDDYVYSKCVIDNMILEGLCNGLIVVTPTFYRDSSNMGRFDRYWEQAQLMPELRNDILPYIVSHYSTYASSPDTDGICAAREHFAYAGLSMGSIYAYNTIMPNGQDLFAWFGCFSGSECDVRAVTAALNAPEVQQYPIRYFYNAIGEKDGMRDQHYEQFAYIIHHTERLSEAENAVFIDHPDVAHEYRGWIMDLYNCLLVFFDNR